MADQAGAPGASGTEPEPATGPSGSPGGHYDFPVDLRDPTTAPAILAQHVPPGAAVLDIGCASGNLLLALRDERGCAGVGLELDPVAVAAARAKGLEVHRIDLAHEPLDQHVANRRFDRVILADVLEHLADPASVLRAVPPLLSPGGQVLVSLPNPTHFDVILAMSQDRFEYTQTGLLDATHLRFFTLASFGALALACGLRVAGVDRHIAPPLATEIWRGGVDLPERYLAMLEQLVRAGNPNADVYQFILVLEPENQTPTDPLPATVTGPVAIVLKASAAPKPDVSWLPSAQVEGLELIRLAADRSFGAALLEALDRLRSPAVLIVGDGERPNPTALPWLAGHLRQNPALAAACGRRGAAAPGPAAPGPEPQARSRIDRRALFAGRGPSLGRCVIKTSAIRLAVRSVAALGAPFLDALDPYALVCRVAQWGDFEELDLTSVHGPSHDPPIPDLAPEPPAVGLALVPVPAPDLIAWDEARN